MVRLDVRRPGLVESAPRGTLAANDVVGFTGVLVATVPDPPMGIVVDTVPTDDPPESLKVWGKGTIIHDDTMDGVAQGTLVWSDGDGTYSITKPTSGAIDTIRWVLGIVRQIDTDGTDTGCDFELTLDSNTDAVT